MQVASNLSYVQMPIYVTFSLIMLNPLHNPFFFLNFEACFFLYNIENEDLSLYIN